VLTFFSFRPKSDKVVVSHFYEEGYRIKGNKPRLIFDVGANIGDETLRFRAFHPNATIIAIEPSSRNISFLKQNFHRDPNVHVLHAALWHSSGKVKLNTSGHSFESFAIVNNSAKNAEMNSALEEVSAITVSEVLALYQLNGISIDIFKIDVEGAERFVFCHGDTAWIDDVNVIIMEMPDSDAPGSFQEIMYSLYSCGRKWETYICGENIVMIKTGSGFVLEKVVGLGVD
jgi:FkbM family methyltransferase